jgi:hypothetical protein
MFTTANDRAPGRPPEILLASSHSGLIAERIDQRGHEAGKQMRGSTGIENLSAFR